MINFAATLSQNIELAMSHMNSLKSILWPAYGAFCVGYVIVTLILLYHWRRYALKNARIIFAQTVYLLISGVMLATAAVALLAM